MDARSVDTPSVGTPSADTPSVDTPSADTARAATVARSTDAAELRATALEDRDPRVRAVAIAALVRTAPRRTSAPVWRGVAADPVPAVRRRAAEVAPALGRSVSCTALLALLADDDTWVAEAAAYAIGEHPAATRRALETTARTATSHRDPLVREAAVAALGAQGDPATLPAVLAACDDRPAIRRRAVLALAAFDGPEVEQRLQAALSDPDWQVRQAAEDLLSEGREAGIPPSSEQETQAKATGGEPQPESTHQRGPSGPERSDESGKA